MITMLDLQSPDNESVLSRRFKERFNLLANFVESVMGSGFGGRMLTKFIPGSGATMDVLEEDAPLARPRLLARITGPGASDGLHQAEEAIFDGGDWIAKVNGRVWDGGVGNYPELREVNGRIEIAEGEIVEVTTTTSSEGEVFWWCEKDQGDKDGDLKELRRDSEAKVGGASADSADWDRDDQGEDRGFQIYLLNRVVVDTSLPEEEAPDGCTEPDILQFFFTPVTVEADGHWEKVDGEATPFEYIVPNNKVALDAMDTAHFLGTKLTAGALDNNGEAWVWLDERAGVCGKMLVIGHRNAQEPDPNKTAQPDIQMDCDFIEGGEGDKQLTMTIDGIGFDRKGHSAGISTGDQSKGLMGLTTVEQVTAARVDASTLKIQKKTRTLYVPCADAESDWIDVHTGEDCLED
jgi:hypothetical protein